MTTITGSTPLGRVPLSRVALVWLALAIFLLVRGITLIAGRQFPDPDDVLRLVQVRDLLAGQGWFDLHQYRIDGPGGTLMHWSRIVDAPLALAISALSPLLGQDLAEQVVVVAMPLVTLGAILLAVAKAASYYLDREGVTLACLCTGLAPLLLVQVQPLRIDHHGWQIFTVVLALVGVAQGRAIRGALLAGLALAFGLSISLEVLPIAAGFGLVYALRWLADGAARRSFAIFLAALAGGLAVLFLVTRGLADLAQHCDVISPAHLVLFVIVALGGGSTAWLHPQSRPLLLALLGMTGLIALGAYLWLSPQCAAGPFGHLDPLVREFWYENIAEGRPAWRVAPSLWVPIVAHGAIASAVLAYLWRHTTDRERRWWFEYLIVMGATFASGLLTWRSMAFVGALSAIPLGWLAARFLKALGETKDIRRKGAIALVLVLALVPSLPVAIGKAIAGVRHDDAETVTPAVTKACALAESTPDLNRLAPAVVFAPFDLGPLLLLESHHRVVATPHHRGQEKMRDIIAAFLGSPEQARRVLAKHQAGYLLICADAGEVVLYEKKAPNGFAAMLVRGEIPDWLEPIEASSTLKLWRVIPFEPDPGETPGNPQAGLNFSDSPFMQ